MALSEVDELLFRHVDAEGADRRLISRVCLAGLRVRRARHAELGGGDGGGRGAKEAAAVLLDLACH
jgi:hypothetical protein